MKKRWTRLAAGVTAAVMLAGCGAGNSKQQDTKDTSAAVQEPAESNGPEGEKVTIRCSWWGGDARHQAMLNAIELYQEKIPM